MVQLNIWPLAGLGMVFITPCQASQESSFLTTFSIQVPTSLESGFNSKALIERNIVFVPSSSSQSSTPTSSSPITSTIGSNTNTDSATGSISSTSISTISNSSATSNSTVYRLDIPESSGGSSNLKYLYLFFLLLGLIILALIARVIILKRRRAKKQEKRAYNRNEALRLDLENRASDENQTPERNENVEVQQGEPAAPPRTGYTFPLFSMSLFRHPSNGTSSNRNRDQHSTRDMEEVFSPPPPYPTHVKPAYHRDARLPVYQEASEEEESDDRESRFSDNHSQQQLRNDPRDESSAVSTHTNQRDSADLNAEEPRRTANEEGFSFVSPSSSHPVPRST